MTVRISDRRIGVARESGNSGFVALLHRGSRLADRWDWRLSARFRGASLASIWVLLLCSSILGPVLAPFIALRFGLSAAQTVLNFRLGRRHPLGRRPRLDWILLAATLAAAYAAAAAGASSMTDGHILALLPMAALYSAIQVRMCRRSLRAAAPVPIREPVPLARYATELSEAA